jgi:hypothetical protein
VPNGPDLPASARRPWHVRQLGGSRFPAFNFLASFPKHWSYDSVVERPLCRSKRVIPVVPARN